MAANNQIVKKSIQIDAGDTLRTVKSLKQEISDLRDELLNLEQGTQEYDDVQKQLQEDVNDLNTVMGAHKDKAEALEGSYDDLQNQLKELKAAWKSTNDEAERDVLGQKINDLNNQLKEMDASIGDFHRNVGNYESAWNGLTGVMENGEKITDDLGKGIKAFGTAIGLSEKQVNGLSDVLKRLKDGFKIAKDITKAKEETANLSVEQAKAAATGAGLATSQKATGAAAKTMAVSETAAAGATKGLSIAMKGLKAALVSTGIGALIVALGTLIGLLDKAYSKAKQARLEEKYANLNKSSERLLDAGNKYLGQLEDAEHTIELSSRKREARQQNEKEILEYQLENYKKMEEWAAQRAKDYKAAADTYEEWLNQQSKATRENENLNNTLKERKKLADAFAAKVEEYGKTIQKIKDDIAVYDVAAEYAKTHTQETANELKKWADLVKDPKFQEAWKGLFETDFEGNSPIEVLKAQREAAVALVNQFKGDTSEVERYFDQMISEAEAEWQSLVEKEQQIFDERLTPAQRLENEKAEWIEKANRWGMDATTIVKYYDDKIKEELDKAVDEEREETERKLNDFASGLDSTLDTQEKLHEMFTPLFTGANVTDEIMNDMDNLQTLYDTQMEYLNGLLETADLTEEEYAEVEDRILSLTVAFNKQMDSLKSELNVQGQNVKIFGKEIHGLSKKAIANFQLMEGAAQSFSDVFQSLGMENSVAFKGFATAQALISAILAANRVLAEEPGEMWIKIAAAAATLTAGLANVAAIWAVNPDGSNAGSSMGMSMQSATPVIGDSQPINYTRNLTTAEEEDQMNQPIYVTVTDIEDGINGRRAQVQNTSF